MARRVASQLTHDEKQAGELSFERAALVGMAETVEHSQQVLAVQLDVAIGAEKVCVKTAEGVWQAIDSWLEDVTVSSRS